jgi:PleD family two-component response regulator
LSVGVSTLHQAMRGADVDARARELVAAADRALYAAKRAGRNRVVFGPGGATTPTAARWS